LAAHVSMLSDKNVGGQKIAMDELRKVTNLLGFRPEMLILRTL